MDRRNQAEKEQLLATLRERYGVAVNDSLLASLDFGSEDPAVQAALRESEVRLLEANAELQRRVVREQAAAVTQRQAVVVPPTQGFIGYPVDLNGRNRTRGLKEAKEDGCQEDDCPS